ncbi:MAG: PDZ domain-containing protein [Patescibacteria group bacterium]|jgi:membrane-associated protease RseP (regulator of RpoE activity)
MFEHKKKEFFWQVAFTAFIFAVIAGSASGLITAVLANQSLDRYYQSLLEEQELTAISQVKPQVVPGTFEESASTVREHVKKIAAFVHAKTVDASTVSGLKSMGDYSGVCVIVTTDGWIACHSDAFSDYYNPLTQAEIWIEESRYPITEIVYDNRTSLAMAKVTAENLTPVAFGEAKNVHAGSMLFALTGPQVLVPTNLAGTQMTQAKVTLPDSQFVSGWVLPSLNQNAPLFNSSGDMVGFASGTEGLSLTQAYPGIESVLSSGKVSHASLGATVVHIPGMLNADASFFEKTGALVTAIVAGSPASLAGLQVNDIVLSIGGTTVDEIASMADILAGYKSGDTATLEVWREGASQKIDVVFGSDAELF